MIKLLKNLTVYKWIVLAILGLVFIQSMSDLFLPTLMADIIDKGVVVGDIPYIWKIGGLMLLVSAFSALASVAASFYSSKAAMGFGRDIRRKVFTHVESFSLQDFDKVGTASLITRTTNDITQLQQVVIMMLRMVVSAPIMFVGGLVMALSKDAKLSLVIVAAMPVLIGAILLVLYKGVPLFKTVQKRLDRLNLVLRENLTGIRVVRSFNREKEEQVRLRKANEELTDVSIKVNKLMAFLMPIMMLVMNITIVGVIWFGGIRIDSGSMQIGDLMAYIQYVTLIMFSLVMASMMFIMIPRAAVSAKRINEVLDMKPTFLDEGTELATKERGTLEFKNVSFNYPEAEEPALSDISFKAKSGEVTAIIGGTGAGKTTLINLIPRFYDVSRGTILVNGVDTQKSSQEEIRSKIGFVPQKALLFTGTIAENIRFGKQDATQAEIEHAARIAQAADFINDMKDGYESTISQGGSNVSGGQKQRLSIARALIRKPDIYIFDDSFSALDYKTDANLRAALKDETKDATVVIVAQRVSTVIDANQIIVLDRGQIAGIGTHKELLETNSVYQEIVQSQLSEEEIA
ncbi:ABC transporter ATP-binding protein [Sporosarcina sp. G11-34]|uniref:ABC transporter ATP-binding protein n=1 Tax=Sporosarcina sp. G11-34 TaxID=2849605 RepID=UPI0022A932CF|nr:ABC transporter ATP-binding protein [Sporosarcina sp. G11-34]MCZ2258112.1 ABC transporter ATP-binding protein/permease [Sporosarcina sp. G11-34]